MCKSGSSLQVPARLAGAGLSCTELDDARFPGPLPLSPRWPGIMREISGLIVHVGARKSGLGLHTIRVNAVDMSASGNTVIAQTHAVAFRQNLSVMISQVSSARKTSLSSRTGTCLRRFADRLAATPARTVWSGKKAVIGIGSTPII